jgi:predicted ATPase with chaperone activity
LAEVLPRARIHDELRWTIADMAGSDGIASQHLAEAIQYRQRVRG